jgi:DNA polymerase III epsilon subunit-like protein
VSNTKELISSIAQRCPGGKLPDDYLVIDIETSGFNYNPPAGKKPDVIVQVGYAAVRNRQVVANFAHYVRRPRGTMKGEALKVTGITDDILQAQGEQPDSLYARLIRLLRLYRSSRCMFVGHNVVSFDGPFMSREFGRMGIDFTFKPDEFIDTGCMFKAAQMGALIGPHEKLSDYFERVRNTRSYVKWRLEFAIATYEINKKHDLDLNKAHDASFDCYLTHLLLEEFRALMSEGEAS